jgi:hypothetical protein
MKPCTTIQSITAVALLIACSNSNNSNNSPAANTKVSLGTAEAGDMTVELLTDTKLETGLTPVYIKIVGVDGKSVTDANVSFFPLMSMSTGMSHTCPVLGKPVLAQGDLFHVDVVFQMATTDVDTWNATVGVNDTDADANDAVFPKLMVTDSGRAQVFTYTDPATSVATRYVSSLNFTNAPKVGLNPVIFTLHTRQDMMTFPEVDNVTIELDPQMPSMGHGSPGSVNPTSTSLGRYEGQLSFSMAGSWETTVTVSRGGVTLGTPKFTTTF